MNNEQKLTAEQRLNKLREAMKQAGFDSGTVAGILHSVREIIDYTKEEYAAQEGAPSRSTGEPPQVDNASDEEWPWWSKADCIVDRLQDIAYEATKKTHAFGELRGRATNEIKERLKEWFAAYTPTSRLSEEEIYRHFQSGYTLAAWVYGDWPARDYKDFSEYFASLPSGSKGVSKEEAAKILFEYLSFLTKDTQFYNENHSQIRKYLASLPSNPKGEGKLQSVNPNLPNYIPVEPKSGTIPDEWLRLWNEIQEWYGDIEKRESAEKLIGRLSAVYCLSFVSKGEVEQKEESTDGKCKACKGTGKYYPL